jgi:ABC-type sulfate/molybdate transport systems ATPase subunit
MIRLDDVALDAGPVALRALSLDVPAGGVGAITGPAGAGKTSLLEAIAGLRPVRAGRIVLAGADVTALPPERRDCGVVFQRGWLFEHLDVAANVAYGMRDARVHDAAVRATGVRALHARPVRTLSGGERQLVALARALARGPRTLLLDEPWSAMDATLHAAMREAVHAWRAAHGTTVLLVTHDPADLDARVDARLALPAGGLAGADA